MKTKNTATLVLSTLLAGMLLGCGSSDTDTQDTLSGYFIDAAVQNCDYNTSSGISGRTDENGMFRYRMGDTVSFAIGNLELGETTLTAADAMVTPAELISGLTAEPSQETLTFTLQLLQSLDADNNTSNGITIPEDVIVSLQTQLAEGTTVTELNATEAVELLGEYVDEDHDGEMDVTQTEAMAHYEESLTEWRNEHTQSDNGMFDIALYPRSENLSNELIETIAYMGNEERLAYDVYTYLYNYHKENSGLEIRQLYNIATNAESKHIEIVQSIVERYSDIISKEYLLENNLIDVNSSELSADADVESVSGVYDIEAIQELYDSLTAQGVASQQAALEVGCIIEVVDVNDLDRDIALAEESNATDIVAAYEVLRAGSYSHYWAFDKGLKNLGVSEGCAVLGDEYNHPEYPQEESGSSTNGGHGGGSGNGNGFGHGRN